MIGKNLTVGTKLGLTSASLVGLTLLLGAITIYSSSSVNRSVESIAADALPGLDRITRAQAGLLRFEIDAWELIATPDRQSAAEIERRLAETRRTLQSDLEGYNATITTAEDRALFDRFRPAVERCFARWETVLPVASSGRTAEAASLYSRDVDPAFTEAYGLLHTLTALNRRNGETSAALALAAARSARLLTAIILLISLAAGALLSFLAVRGVNGVLRRAVTDLHQGASQVASAAAQVSSSSQALAQGASEQAASLQETSASNHDVRQMSRQNSQSAAAVAELMVRSRQKVLETNQALDLTVSAMDEINAHSTRISKIIKTIDEIAFQTNILALNAAVEAARAGQSGMGFAVVAEEVRNLAQRCAQAAQDTSSLIEESIAKAGQGKQKVDQVAASIRAITAESAEVKALIDNVNADSQAQARAIDQIGKAISQMERVTQSNAASAEEGASAAEELSSQSEALRHIVEELSATVDGRNSHRETRPIPLRPSFQTSAHF